MTSTDVEVFGLSYDRLAPPSTHSGVHWTSLRKAHLTISPLPAWRDDAFMPTTHLKTTLATLTNKQDKDKEEEEEELEEEGERGGGEGEGEEEKEEEEEEEEEEEDNEKEEEEEEGGGGEE
ncbi:hypothetical protein ElyMa_002143000 [Elysia marginata]|uniref:Uncharacterized protein n=1 Tax=Elysia marginata TaxID=1093978 RepID=A0AAV4FJY8_9GAST|nr:hypothetical protein ElyMa_002143000 [Elysia marginata]